VFLPLSLDELVPKEHLVRLVNQTIEELKIDALLSEAEYREACYTGSLPLRWPTFFRLRNTA
jgi:hypothetical protein